MPDTKDLFNRISKNYDLLNTVFSAGIDSRWRKRLVNSLELNSDVLDVATGTAEVLIEGFKATRFRNCFGIDPSIEMLRIGKSKLKKYNHPGITELLQSTAENLPFKDNSFDAVTIAFGIRNTLDYDKSLSEMFRVLKKGGKIAILEFAIPKLTVFSSVYLFYFRYIMPFIGSLYGNKNEYRYLSESTSEFPQREKFVHILEKSGFKECKFREISLGIAIIYTAIK